MNLKELLAEVEKLEKVGEERWAGSNSNMRYYHSARTVIPDLTRRLKLAMNAMKATQTLSPPIGLRVLQKAIQEIEGSPTK